MRAQTVADDRILFVLGYAEHMLARPSQSFALVGNFPLNDLFTLRATLGCLGALVNISTDRADKFLVHWFDILGLITFFSGREGRFLDGSYVAAYG